MKDSHRPHGRLAAVVAFAGSALVAGHAGAQTTWLVSNDPSESPDFAHPRAALLSPLVVSGDTILVSRGIAHYFISQIDEPLDFGAKNVVMRAEAGEQPVVEVTGGTFPTDARVLRFSGGQSPACRLEGIRFIVGGFVQTAVTISNASSPTISDCHFEGGCRASLVDSYDESAPTFEGCTFIGVGGTFANVIVGGDMTLRNCRIEGSFTSGPAVILSGNVLVTGCEFIDNENFNTDGTANDLTVRPGDGESARIENCLFTCSVTLGAGAVNTTGPTALVNCVFDRYTSEVTLVQARTSTIAPYFTTVTNCTFAHNPAGGLAQASGNAAILVRNAIAWGNTGPATFTGTISVERSIVQGGFPGTSNLNVNPLFSNPSLGDYSLQPGSPAIDSGDNTAVPSGVFTDFAGLPRFVDDPDTANTGVGTAPIVDRGAFEFQGEGFCQPDLTTTANPLLPGFGTPNGVLNNDDFFYYLLLFQAVNPGADMTTTAIPGSPGYGVPNGVINNDDFFYYLLVFAEGC